MAKPASKTYIILILGLLGTWLFARWGLPVLLPFLLGAALALAAEPMVGRLSRRLPRALAAGIGVTMVLILLLALLVMLVALLVREAGRLTGVLPQLAEAARQGMGSLELWLLGIASRAPGGVGAVLTDSVTELFSGGSALMDRVLGKVLSVASNILSGIPDGALGFGTGILAAYMISARLPRIRSFLADRLPESWRGRFLPALKGMKDSLLGYLTAQFKLMCVTFLILTLGFFALQIPYAPVWAAVVAFVDAIPVLGTGTVLIPWALVCLLRGSRVRGIGLLAVYVVAWLTRSVLEPKLLGKELGLDPLVTLTAMYAGYRFFGFAGLILSPVAAVAILRLTQSLNQTQGNS